MKIEILMIMKQEDKEILIMISSYIEKKQRGEGNTEYFFIIF